jgi:hypothetical protein
VVFDYRDADRAVRAQRLLWAAGIGAVYIPDKLVAVSTDPNATLWLVQRLEVPAPDAERARALLDEYSLGC